MAGLNRLILFLAGALIVLYSTSEYAIALAGPSVGADIELNEESSEDQVQISSYDAVVPVVQVVQPSIRHLLGEIVVITKPLYPNFNDDIEYLPRYREVLFPTIISPNAP